MSACGRQGRSSQRASLSVPFRTLPFRAERPLRLVEAIGHAAVRGSPALARFTRSHHERAALSMEGHTVDKPLRRYFSIT